MMDVLKTILAKSNNIKEAINLYIGDILVGMTIVTGEEVINNLDWQQKPWNQ